MKRVGRTPRSLDDIESHIEWQLKNCYTVDAEKGCWLWTGQKSKAGYGHLARHLPRSKYNRRAHIAAYQLYRGVIPKGLYVCHECDVKGCMNPKHLWLGTNQENQIDARDKGILHRHWTPEKRLEKSIQNSGAGNPMYGMSGEKAPCFGRTGAKHPMFGKNHSVETKLKISQSLKQRNIK